MKLKPKQPIQKRSFLLIEVVIAFTLLTLCLTPLLHTAFALKKAELKQLSHIYHEREARNLFLNFKQELYEFRDYSFDELKNLKKGEKRYLAFKDKRVEIEQIDPTIKQDIALLQITVMFKEDAFHFPFLIQRKKA